MISHSYPGVEISPCHGLDTCLPACSHMGQVPDDNDYKFFKWLDANGLNVPQDFKFAFTSAVGAANACPEAPVAAAEAWKAIGHNDVEVSSSWTLWIKSRRCGSKLGARQLSRPPIKLWRGLRTRKACAGQGSANDSVRRRSAAKDALHVALSCKSFGRLAKEWYQLDPSRRDGWFSLQITRIATTERLAQSSLRCAHGNTGAHGAVNRKKVSFVLAQLRQWHFWMPQVQQQRPKGRCHGHCLQHASTI